MANVIGELVYKITGDSSGLNRTIKKTDSQIKGTSKSFFNLGNVIKAAFSIAIIKAIFNVGKRLVNLGSDAEETANKFGVVFDAVIDSANRAAEELSISYGLARTESKKLLANTGDLLTGFGVAKDKALELSLQTQKLAVDLASFTNYAGGASGASDALTKALLGETESAKGLGLVLGENALKEYAEGQGLVFKELSRTEKMQLRLNLAISQSPSAIGDFNRSIDSYANQMRIARARTQDLAEENSKTLLPLVTLGIKAYNSLAESLIKSSRATNEYLQSAEGIERVSDIFGTFVGILNVLWESLKIIIEPLKDVAKTIGNEWVNGFSELSDELGGASSGFSFLGGVLQVFTSVLKVTGAITVSFISIFIDLVKIIIQSAKTLGGFFKALKTGDFTSFNENAKKVGATVLEIGEDAKRGAKNIASAVTGIIDDFSSGAEANAKKTTEAFDRAKKNAKEAAKNALQQKDAVKSVTSATEENTKSNKKNKDSITTLKQEYNELAASIGNVNAVLTLTDKYGGQVLSNFSSLLSAYSSYLDARSEAESNRLDQQMEAELAAAGLSEQTAIEKAQSEIDAAIAAGDTIAQADAEKALQKAQIEEKYRIKKAKAEYDAALASWEIQKSLALIQLFQAPLNAYVSSLTAPWPLNMILAPLNAGIALATAGLQYQAVVASKPTPPKFATGGIVPGSSFTGDNIDIKANSGEMILNEAQQGQLFDIANGKQSNNNLRPVVIDSESMFDMLFRASKNNQLFISANAVVS